MKKNIAYLVTPVQFGGSEKVSFTFLQTVNRQTFKIQLVCFFRPWEAETFFLKELTKLHFPVYKIPVSLGKRDYLWFFRRFRMLCVFLREGNFDLLHSHGYAADIIGIPCANILGIPTISTCHGFVENDKKLCLYNWLDRIILRFSDRIIAVSTDIQRDLIKRGIRSIRIKLIPNAVQTDIDETSLLAYRRTSRMRFEMSETEFVLGYVGRLSEEKGVSFLIQAACLLRNANCPIKLLIIGEGSKKAELMDLVRRKHLENDVIFAGFQNNVDQLLPAMDVFALPSLTEGTPMAILEAMANGIPVVASSVGDIPRIIESGRDGMLFHPGSPEEIAAKVQTLYNDRSLRARLAKAAQDKVKSQFDVKQWTKRIEAEYMRTICEAT